MKGRAVLTGLALGISTTLSVPALAHESALPIDCAAPVASRDTPARVPRMANTTVALALGSGSMHGFAHIGVLEELEARGFEASVVTGTSAGALVGSLYASGLSGTQIESLMHATDWEGARRFVISREALFSNDPLRERLSEVFASRPIESWPRRFGAVATNVADGALVEPNPVQAARDLGADFVLAVDVAYRPYEESPGGMSDLAFQSLHILVNALGARELRDADAAVRLDVHGIFSKCGADGAIAAGREAVRRAWPEIVGAMMLRNERRAAR